MFTSSPSATARWALAAVLLLFCRGLDLGSWGFNAFMNFVVFIAALILVVYEAVPWLAGRFSLAFVEVYFPNLNFPKPPLSYTLARHYRVQGRLEEAAQEYQKIIRYYPREEAAYTELIEVAEQMEDRKLGGRYAALYYRRFSQGAPVASK
jgi:hypothetical protein